MKNRVQFPDQPQRLGALSDAEILRTLAIAAGSDEDDAGFRFVAIGPKLRARLNEIAARLETP